MRQEIIERRMRGETFKVIAKDLGLKPVQVAGIYARGLREEKRKNTELYKRWQEWKGLTP